MIYHVRIGERSWTVELSGDEVFVDGRTLDVDFARVEGGPVRSLVVNHESHRLVARRSGEERWDLHLRGRRMTAEVVDERTRVIRSMTKAATGPTGPRPIRAPMPGMVVRIEVAEGDRVRTGQGVVIVEAMKMENELAAPTDAVVGRIHVEEGQAVEKDQILVDLLDPGQAAAT
jgi:pyruvate carboxylase subunit B